MKCDALDSIPIIPAVFSSGNTTLSKIPEIAKGRKTRLLHLENIICLTREPKGRLRQPPDERKEAAAMVTYSELFTFVIMLCAVITLVVTIMKCKK